MFFVFVKPEKINQRRSSLVKLLKSSVYKKGLEKINVTCPVIQKSFNRDLNDLFCTYISLYQKNKILLFRTE